MRSSWLLNLRSKLPTMFEIAYFALTASASLATTRYSPGPSVVPTSNSNSTASRSRHPLKQDDPDLYLRVVERRDDGIVVRGAKLHITGAALVHELVVLPTKAMGEGEEDYAVAFSVPTATKGIKIINRNYAEPGRSVFDYPVSGRRNMPEGFVIFDDVFVP
ncbi:MAG: hypothetical protein IIA67_14445, partial [Planctomycetes bacterium]|nr:hypothetical protein [Planctomycetota bacterium]